MSKIELLNEKFIQARKNKNEIAKSLFSTFRGEYDTAIKSKSPENDATIEKIAKKMTDNARIVGTADALQEIELLKPFMPIMMGEQEIKDIITQVANENPDKVNNFKLGNKGVMMGFVMKKLAGKADANQVKELMDMVLS